MKQTPVYLGRKKREHPVEDAEEKSLAIDDSRNDAQMQVVGQIDVLVDTEFDYEELF